MRSSKFSRWFLLFLLLALPGRMDAAEFSIDFEGLTPDLPGWSAQFTDENNKAEYRSASKWDVPMVFRLEGDRPHAGLKCLQWEITGKIGGLASIRPPLVPVTDREVSVSFYVRSRGFSEEGMLSVDEMKDGKDRLKIHWNVARIPVGDQWEKVEWKAVLDPATTILRVSFSFKTPPAGASFWLDDLYVAGIVGDYR